MALQRSSTFVYDPGANTEYPVRFRFPLTWSYLSAPNEIDKPVEEPAPGMPILFTARVPPDAGRAPAPAVSGRRGVHDGPKPAKDQSKQWEMVIPKMAQPGTRLVQAVPPKPISAPKPVIEARVEPRIETRIEPRIAAPQVAEPQVAAPLPDVFNEPFPIHAAKSSSTTLRWSLILAAAVGGVVSLWGMLSTPKAARPVPVVSSAHWVSERALFVAGSKEQRRLILYRGAEQPTDFRAEFDWKPDPKGVGLIFRCSDRGNYQAVRVGIASWRPSLSLFEEHFTVLGGIETVHARKLITWTTSSDPIHIALDGTGFEFMLYVQGNHFDYWTDNRLKKGDVGFYEDRDEPRSVESPQFKFANHAMPDFNGAFSQIAKAIQ